MPERNTVALRDLCVPSRSITYGIVQPGKLHDGGVPIVRVNNFRGHRLDLQDRLHVAPEIDANYRRSRPKPGDVLISLVGSIGQVAIAPPEIEGWNLARAVGLVPMVDQHSARWVYFALQTQDAQNFIRRHANTTVQATFNLKDLARFPIPYPDRREREQVLEILGSLDDKIELNRRMNETLEAMAQAIFRDWFVDFGPTHRKIDGAIDPVEIMGGLVADPDRAQELAELFPARLGDDGLPEGWQEKPLGEMFDVVMGQSPPGSTYNEVGDGLPFFQGRRDFGFRFPEERVFCTEPTRIANADWTLVSVRAPVGDVNRATKRCCIGRGVAAVCHKANLRSFTYYAVLALKPELARFDGDGTVFGSINQKQMKALTVVGADHRIAQEFERIATAIDDLIRSRTDEICTLTATRDLLLPKLMSGEICLHGVENELEAAQ